MKIIGIIGGMSVESTAHYYERINKQVNESLGGLTSAKLLIYNVNFEEIRQMMLTNNWVKIGEILSEAALVLEKAGADYIVVATNTMHKVADAITSKISIPLIHIADCVADKCKLENINRVGLIGTKYTMVEDFLINKLKANGLDVYVPNEESDLNEIDRIIFDELCKGIVLPESKQKYIDIINHMIDESNIKGLILGCTEIEMLIKNEDIPISLFDTTQAHIDAITNYSIENK